MADSPHLEAFFNHRTIGFDDRKWYWRGQGYDEGWADVTRDDLLELHRLLTTSLNPVGTKAELDAAIARAVDRVNRGDPPDG